MEIMEPKLHKLNAKFWKILYQETVNAHFTIFAKSVRNNVKVKDGATCFL
jgi:hypothetical protein